jgi:PAS domain-containing protein
MPEVSEFAEFAERLQHRRERIARSASAARHDAARAGDAGTTPLDRTVRLLDRALADLGAAEKALRAQNDALFSARIQLQAREAQFRQLFDLAPTAYLVTTADNTRIVRLNDAACTLLRRAPNAVVDTPLACYVELADRPPLRAAVARARRSHAVEECPLRVVPAGGAPVECRARLRTLPASSGGEPVLAWCISEESGDALDEL